MSSMNRRLPAEFEPQQAVLISFPHEGADWPGKFQAAQWAFVDFIRKISLYEKIVLVVKSASHFDKVKSMLLRAHVDLSRIDPLIQNTNRSWMRDSGPIIVRRSDNSLEALHFSFNGWAKYANHRKDQKLARAVAEHLKLPLTRVLHDNIPVVLEGGAIDTNGNGTLITTHECLLDPINQVRNPGFQKVDYEKIFLDYFGITNVIWLQQGIEGDDTHGHVDDICRFVNRNTVVACRELNRNDMNHRYLEENIEILRSVKLENGEGLNIEFLPMPARIDFEDLRLPASYANFLILNNCVLVPTFNDPNDTTALGVLRDVFPDREVIGINCVDLVWGLGTLHCLSHEIPG